MPVPPESGQRTLLAPDSSTSDETPMNPPAGTVGPKDRSLSGRWTMRLAVVLWGVAIAAGTVYGFLYETTPASRASAAEHWPQRSLFPLSPRRPMLVMFVHPHCPCSRASLSELAVLMTDCRGRVEAHVLFFKPPSASDDWVHTDLWRAAARIPGVTPHIDRKGTEQRRFGAGVSGEVFLYLPDGSLAFHGGITASRGHAGDNAGRSAIESLLLNNRPPAGTTPVFGCGLRTPGSCCRRNLESIETTANP